MANPHPTPKASLALLAGQRWTVSTPKSSSREIIQTGMDEAGPYVAFRYLPGGKVRYSGQIVKTRRSAFLAWIYLRSAVVFAN